jgi:hypothetical protein
MALFGRFRIPPNASYTQRFTHIALHTPNRLTRYELLSAGRPPVASVCTLQQSAKLPAACATRYELLRGPTASGQCPPFPAQALARYEPQLAGRLPRPVLATRLAPAAGLYRPRPASIRHEELLTAGALRVPSITHLSQTCSIHISCASPDRHITCPRPRALAAPQRRPHAAWQPRILAAPQHRLPATPQLRRVAASRRRTLA